MVANCSVAIGTFDAIDLRQIEAVFMRPLAIPLPPGDATGTILGRNGREPN
jgi:hypothetical protein